MASTAEIMKQMHKDHGKDIVTLGAKFFDVVRIPTGIFAFDLATGGGFPQGKISIVYGPESSGKCHAAGDRVMLFDGSFKNVEDVVTGDTLMGVDSTPRTVLGIGGGYGDLFKITATKGGDSFTVNADHVLSLVCTHDQGLRKKGDVINISLRDYMAKSNDWKVYHHLYRVPVSFPKKSVKLDPYFLGLWLGDGASLAPAITTMDQEIIDWLQNYADRNGWDLRAYTAKDRCTSYAVVGDKGQSVSDTPYQVPYTLLKSLGVIGNKHIPDVYKINDRATQLAVLAGLIDSDGSKGKSNSIMFYNTNLRLCEDVLFLARSLGYYASLSPKKGLYKGEEHLSWVVYLSGDFSDLPLLLKRKRPAERLRSGSHLTSRFSVEPVGEGRYYGFQLDGDHLYLLDNFIVSHNTNLIYKAMAMCQILWPDKNVVMIDAEDGFDPEWAGALGVNVDRVVIVKPDYAEQAVDFTEAFLYADDVSMVALDSIPALITENESKSSAEKMIVGGNSNVVGRLIRKAVKAQRTCNRDKKFAPALICINQIRHKIGVMFGNPECLHGDTLVNFVDGRSIPIRTVVEQKIDAPIWAFDEDKGVFFESRILSHHYNGVAKDGDFLTVTSQGLETKNGIFSATVTYTHKFLTHRGWTTAGELLPDDLLLTKYRSVISSSLQEFLTGSLVGDCTVTRSGNNLNSGLRYQDSLNQDYVAWKVGLLTPHFKVSSRGHVADVSPTYELTKFAEPFSGRNPAPFFANFSWLSMAIWLMDDGHYAKEHRRYVLSVKRYKDDPEMLGFIEDAFSKVGLHGFWNQGAFTFTVQCSEIIAANCTPYFPTCMAYKSPTPELCSGDTLTLCSEGIQYLPAYVPLISVEQASKRKYRDRGLYDLHIEGHHNYLAGNMDNGFVVHNTMPGGNAPKFASSLTVRIYGKNEMDTKVDDSIPAYKDTSIILQKWKVPILAINSEYKMLMLHNGDNSPGHVNDWNTIAHHLKDLDYLTKDKKGWVMFGELYPTLDACKQYLNSDPLILAEAKATIIKEMMSKKHIKPTENVDEGAVEEEEEELGNDL